MSLRVWLILFITSTLISLEVLLWAATHRQFGEGERARHLALRSKPPLPPAPARSLTPLRLGLGALTLAWAFSMVHLLLDAYK